MRWDYYLKVFNLASWGGDIIGSNRIECKLPEDNTVHCLELWAMQHEEDPDFWSVVAIHGQYDFDRGSPSGGVSFINSKSDFLAEEISFGQMIELLENVHMHVRHPETGFRLNAPSALTDKDGIYDDDGIAYRRINGIQKHFTRHEDYAEIADRRIRLRAMGMD